jgi:hypothetical protein
VAVVVVVKLAQQQVAAALEGIEHLRAHLVVVLLLKVH